MLDWSIVPSRARASGEDLPQVEYQPAQHGPTTLGSLESLGLQPRPRNLFQEGTVSVEMSTTRRKGQHRNDVRAQGRVIPLA